MLPRAEPRWRGEYGQLFRGAKFLQSHLHLVDGILVERLKGGRAQVVQNHARIVQASETEQCVSQADEGVTLLRHFLQIRDDQIDIFPVGFVGKCFDPNQRLVRRDLIRLVLNGA